jgi:hypothetical protein
MLVRAKSVAMDVPEFERGAVLTQIRSWSAALIAHLTRACARSHVAGIGVGQMLASRARW